MDVDGAGGEGRDMVLVPRRLLREVIQDGCCPIHLRLQLARAMEGSSRMSKRHLESLEQTVGAFGPCCEELQSTEMAVEGGSCGSDPAKAGLGHCLSAVALFLSLPELLEVRASNREAVQLVMQRRSADAEQLSAHDVIRTRLWMHRIADVTAGTKDESVFETRLRSLADEALRTRMATEMQDALLQMEEQVRAFQGVVDQRLQDQERSMKNMVEERVQQELETLLRSELMRAQAAMEERVRQRVCVIFRQEIETSLRKMQAQLDEMVKENNLLRDAFAEANLRSKCFYWALNPAPLQTSTALLCGLPSKVLLSLRWRTLLAASHPEISMEL